MPGLSSGRDAKEQENRGIELMQHLDPSTERKVVELVQRVEICEHKTILATGPAIAMGR